jgi:membrane protein implicated in regulation of membrane protease activity
MNRQMLLTDLAIAVVVAVLILVLTPGLAISGAVGLLVLLAFALWWLFGRWRRRSGRHRRAELRGQSTHRMRGRHR